MPVLHNKTLLRAVAFANSYLRGTMTAQKHKFEIRISPTKNKSVFTTEHIKAGTEVLAFQGILKKIAEIEDTTHCLQIDKDLYLTSSGQADDFVNHSCIPNCGVRMINANSIYLFAIEDIAPGTELAFDYSTCLSGEHGLMECFCETEKCRGNIGAFKDLPEELKVFYTERNAVLPYLLTDFFGARDDS